MINSVVKYQSINRIISFEIDFPISTILSSVSLQSEIFQTVKKEHISNSKNIFQQNMLGGKRIQNFITFQTKQTIYLKQNQPQLIVHQQTIQTDSLKQLLSKRSSKSKPNFFQSTFKNQLINFENQTSNQGHHKNSHFCSSNSHSKNASKQRSYGSRSKIKTYVQQYQNRPKIKQFGFRQNIKKPKSSKQKLGKKSKSMIRLSKYNEKNLFQLEKQKLCRKSYSPNRNYSEGLKKISQNNCSNQCIKTTKFVESKESTSKNLKSSKTDRNKINKKDQKIKKCKSKQKFPSKSNLNRGYVQSKNLYTVRRKQQQAFISKDTEKNRKKSKRISAQKKSQTNRKKGQETRVVKPNQQKKTPKKIQSTSKSRSKQNPHFQSVDCILLRQRNLQSTKNEVGIHNYLSSRDSFKKKIKTDRDSLNKNNKKPQKLYREKQIGVPSKKLNRGRNDAAIKIQKVYKGYITRKWLNQYLKIIGAAVVIQKCWRGYQKRKIWRQIWKNKHNSYHSIQQSTKREYNLEDSKIDVDKWKNILFQVMEQESVNELIKCKIKSFLQAQGESARSSIVSRKSRNSQQKLKSQMLSQKRYFLKKLHNRQKSQHSIKNSQINNSPDSFNICHESDFNYLESPSNNKKLFKSPNRLEYIFSPQNYPVSPKLQKNESPEKLIRNLHEIQNHQKHNIIQQANNKKKQLHKDGHSPKFIAAKQKQINDKLQQSLRVFEQSIKGAIQSCKNTSQLSLENHKQNDLQQSLVITPQHSYLKQSKQSFLSEQIMSKSFQRINNDIKNRETQVQKVFQLKEEKSVQIDCSPARQVPTYEKFQTFNVNALSSQKQDKNKVVKMKKIDPSCRFLDEYLLTMIQYLRNKNDGQVMSQIVRSVKTWKNLQPYVVLRNLSVVKEQNNQQEDGFSLPLYKYLEDDCQIIKEEYVSDYNRYFNMMKSPLKFNSSKSSTPNSTQNQPVQHYLKLLIDAFNEAINLKRPSKYIFTDRSIETFNNINKVDKQQFDVQSQYDIYCASSMQQIFTWFNVKYGFAANFTDDGENDIEQVFMQNVSRLEIMLKMQAQKKWDQYYQKIQTIAKISQQIYEDLLIKQTITILNIQKQFMKERQILK